MAVKYWVGGAGSWNDTTHWSLVSGGAGGAGIPSAADDCVFDNNSGVGTVLQVSGNCLTLDFTTWAGTFQMVNGQILGIHGTKLKLSPNMTLTGSGTSGRFDLLGATTAVVCDVTCNGKTIPGHMQVTGPVLNQVDALNLSGSLTMNRGDHVTNNNNWNASQFASSNGNVRRFDWGSSTGTLTGTAPQTNMGAAASGTNLTIVPNTATLHFVSAGGHSFQTPNVDWKGLSLIFGGSNNGSQINCTNAGHTIVANVTKTGAASKTDFLEFFSNTMAHFVVTGLFQVHGNSETERIIFRSNRPGSPRAISVGSHSLKNVDFQDTGLRLLETMFLPESFIGGSSWPIYWETSASGISVTNVSDLNPMGGSGAVRMVGTIAASHFLRQVIAVQPGTQYTYSFYAKNNGGTAASYSVYDVTNAANIVAPTSYFATISPGGWQRITITFTTGATTRLVGVYPLRDSAAGADVLAWGHQVDLGPVAQPYTPALIDLSGIDGGAGDAGDNQGMIFSPSRTLYYVKAGSGTTFWTFPVNWSLLSGGPTGQRPPLPQDDVILDTNSGTGRINFDNARIGRNIDASAYLGGLGTSAIGFSSFGNVTLGVNNMAMIGTSGWTMQGRGDHTLTTNGQHFSMVMVMQGGGATIHTRTLMDAFVSVASLSINGIKLVTNSNSLTITFFGATGTANPPGHSWEMGTSVITLTAASGNIFNMQAGGAQSPMKMDEATFVLAVASASDRTFQFLGGRQLGYVVYTVPNSPGAVIFSGGSTLTNISGIKAAPGRGVRFSNTNFSVRDWDVEGEERDYVWLNHASTSSTSNIIRTPDSAAVSMVGTDIELVVAIAPEDYTSAVQQQAVVGNYDSTAFAGWELRLTATAVRLLWGNGTTQVSVDSDAAIPDALNGTKLFIRVRHQINSGGVRRTNFATSPDGVVWTPLGNERTGALSTIADSSQQVYVGSRPDSSAPFFGKVYEIHLRNAIGGADVASFDAAAHVSGNDTYTSPTGETWTLITGAREGDGRVSINSTTVGSQAIIQMPVIDLTGKPIYFVGTAHTDLGYLSLPGTAGNYLYSPDHDDFDFDGDLDFSILMAPNDWSPATANRPLDKWAGGMGGYVIYLDNAGAGHLVWINNAGVSTDTGYAAFGFADGTLHWIRAQLELASPGRKSRMMKSDSVGLEGWTPAGVDQNGAATTVGANTSALHIGGNVGGTTQMFAGRIDRVVMRDGIDGPRVFDADFTKRPNKYARNCNIKDVQFRGHANWYAPNSVNGGNTTGITFDEPDYVVRQKIDDEWIDVYPEVKVGHETWHRREVALL